MNNTAIFDSTDEALSSSVCLEKGRDSPFSLETITITKAEHIELKAQVGYWKAQAGHYKAKFEKAGQDILVLEAKVKDLQQRLFGKKTEKQSALASEQDGTEVPSTRKRGQQPGSQGHGRTPRPNLPVLAITQDLPESAKCCQRCGLPHQAKPVLDETSEVIEVEVSAYVRRYKRTAYVRNAACHCPDTPMIITPLPPPRLLPKSPYGVGFWSEAILAKFHYGQPILRYCNNLHDRGLPVSPGTVASGLQSLLPLFTPVYEALYQKQMTERLFFNDETRWEVFEAIAGKVGSRWYLWLTRSASAIYYVIDPSRSAKVPGGHFKGLSQDPVIIVCDRYSAYKKLARLLPIILLAFCWAHVRRDFLSAGKAFAELADWAVTIKKHIGMLYHLNKQRLLHWNPERPLTEQNAEFSEHHQALQRELDKLHQHATDLVAGSDKADTTLSKAARSQQRKICQSLLNHWPGLMVFVSHPEVPMDNNLGENSLRKPVTGRKNYYGSGSILSAQLAAMLFSILQTLGLWGINPQSWLTDYLSACAENGGRAPEDLAPCLPWLNPRLPSAKASQPMHSRAPPPPSGAEEDSTGNTLHYRPRMTIYRFCGRDFHAHEMVLIRQLLAEDPQRCRAELSRLVCEALHWFKIDGGLKDMSARVAMLRMQEAGLIELPPPRCSRPNPQVRLSERSNPGQRLEQAARTLTPLNFQRVEQKTDSHLWNEYIQRYHYLGHTLLPGAQLRYLIYSSRQQPIALLGFGASAWLCAPRDQYIGWNHSQRQRNLHYVVNNARFLILPWIHSPNLASMILAQAAKLLPDHWQLVYGYRPVLLETFVEKPRFQGTCYKAANWRYLGATKGRGKLGPAGKLSVPIKDLWVLPLDRQFRERLTT